MKNFEPEILVNNLDCGVIIINREAEIIFYKNAHDFILFEVENSKHENLADKVSPELFSLLKKGMSGDIENFDFSKVCGKNEFWISFSVRQIKESEDRFLILFRNITERKTKEENYRSIFENAIMGIYQSTPGKGTHVSVNPELARIYGYDDSEDLLKSITDISHQLYVNPEQRDKLMKSLEEEGQSFGFESQLYRKDGALVWISENAKAVRDERGRLKFIVGTVKDITERKKAEEQMRLAKEDWERTFNAIDNIIIILDKELRVRRFNRAAAEQMKIKTHAPEGQKCLEIFSCGQKDCEICPAKLTAGEKTAHTAEIENIELGKTFLASTSPVLGEEGEFAGVVYIAKDITEEKKLRRESEYRLQQVIQADKLKSLGEMVAGVAHEINNPNGFIVTNVSLLEESWIDLQPLLIEQVENSNNLPRDKEYYLEIANEMQELINSINNGSKRIKNVVANLKDFARVNSPGQTKPIDINEVVNKAFALIGANARKTIKDIQFELEEKIPQVQGHFQKLEQVLINLIMNALQAISDREKGRLKIGTRYINRLKSVLVEVEDNGTGIEPDATGKLFEPFFTTRRDIGGTGLGLSISYEIIKEHNGIIGVHSKKNVGTKFTIYLPVENKLQLNPKILCVDDGEKIPNLLRVSFLEETDKFFSFITEAANVTSFITDHPEIDVVLMNSKFGNFSYELLKKLYTKHPLLDFVLYSETGMPEKIDELSFINYIDYPFNIENLRELLNKLSRLRL